MDIMKITEAIHIDRDIESQPQLVSSIMYAVPVHFHDYFEFFLITKGKCIHRVNNSIQHLTEGALVFIRPDDVHCYDYYGSSDCEFFNIAFTSAVVKAAFDYLGTAFYSRKLVSDPLPPYTILSPLEKENLKTGLEKIKALAAIDKQQSRLQTRSMLVEIFTQYFSNTCCIKSKFNSLWLEMLLTQMQKKENFTAGLIRMSELSGKSAGHVNRVFRQCLNLTPTEYINRIRLSYAKNLIVTSDLNILDIAMESGFGNLSHFNHLFKKSFGVSPTKLRFIAKTVVQK